MLEDELYAKCPCACRMRPDIEVIQMTEAFICISTFAFWSKGRKATVQTARKSQFGPYLASAATEMRDLPASAEKHLQ